MEGGEGGGGGGGGDGCIYSKRYMMKKGDEVDTRGGKEATSSIIKIPSARGVCSSYGLCPTHPFNPPIYKYSYSPMAMAGIASTTSVQKTLLSFVHFHPAFYVPTMSTCGNCDCSDKSQCVKKGNSYNIDIVETEKSYVETFVMEVTAAEHDGKCKCGPSCTCTNCSCGH